MHRYRFGFGLGRGRVLVEHALKHLLNAEHSMAPCERAALADALRLSEPRARRLVRMMAERGLVATDDNRVWLLPAGRSMAARIVRAHRLWERYLADEAQLPVEQVHDHAHHAEHRLSEEQVDALEAHLGHPVTDPHGDPIPARDGTMAALGAVPIDDWQLGVPARVVHIEDEPAAAFSRILALGIHPGDVLTVTGTARDRLYIASEAGELELPMELAASIHVSGLSQVASTGRGALRLSELPLGAEAEVLRIDPLCRGFTRRRLLDMGLTRGARVTAELSNTFGDPRAFRVRGALLALRKEQAAQIWVRPL